MHSNVQNAKRKPYGNGFECIHPSDIRAFINWWNYRSFFPVSEAQKTEAELPMMAKAA